MRKLLFLLFLLVCTFSYGQFSISGKLVNELNEPIENIHIHVGKKTTSSNEGTEKVFFKNNC